MRGSNQSPLTGLKSADFSRHAKMILADIQSINGTLMRFFVFLGVVCVASAGTPAPTMWTEMKAKRDKLPSLHQEFRITQTTKAAQGGRSSNRDIVIDVAQEKWRERSTNGSGDLVKIFDGQDLLRMEEGGEEYTRTKHREKDEDPEPGPYGFGGPDWPKAVEVRRLPCGISGGDHECVIVDVPLKRWVQHGSGSKVIKLVDGTARDVFDTTTGLLVSAQIVEAIDNGRGGYQNDTTYTLKRMKYGGAADASLFKIPPGDLREVKELSKWNAARIRKQLSGQPAPEMALNDLKGTPVSLSGLKGKTVLLDFWTTWCPPCRADGPALEKLYTKYGDKDLMVIGISVSEEREIVEKFLKEHPHTYPIVLTSENEMPRAYQIAVFPTYIVIDRDGTVTTAVELRQGFRRS
jgi:thiol-disulfide isomerase/thioredoxin